MTIRAERALGITLDRFAFVVCTEKGPVGAVTDADGRAVVSVSAPEGPSRVYVAPSEYNRPEGMSQEEFRECKRRTISLVNSVAMPKEMSQVVAAEVSAVEFVWKAERAARSLKMDVGLNEDNEVGLVMFYWLRHGQWVLAGKDPREASINCLRPGHANELFVKTLGPLVVPVPIPAALAVAQGTSEPDPPKLIINLPTYPRESVLQMKVQNFANVYGYDYVYCRGGVTLVRDDGAFVFYFNANAAGDLFAVPRMTNQNDTDDKCRIPAGTYYVSMGRIPERICLAIYDAVKAGRQAELDAAGVTKFTITAGQTLNTTIDAVQTAAAAKAAAGL